MLSDWTFGRKIAAGFALAVLVLIVTSTLGYRSTQKLIENDRRVNHSHQVRRDLADLMALLVDAETGQRGYVITGRDEFLAPYHRALPLIDRALNEVGQLTADNRAQQERLRLLRDPLRDKLAELAETIEMRRNQGFLATERVVEEGRGKRYMDSLRTTVEAMDHEERDLLQRRGAEAEASAANAQLIILWASLLGVAFVVAAAAFIARSLAGQLGDAAGRIQSSSAELQAAATQQASGAREQATAMSEITTTISELLATSRQIAESAQRVAQIAAQTASATRLGDTTVERGTESLGGMRRQVDAIVQHMLDLGKKSQQIGSVLDIVTELAEQTNILAINATIEAAGAGEAGKRFAVVADEIRKLADRVMASTKDVRALIDDVRGAVNTTVMTTEAGSKSVEAGARQFFEVAAAFKEIASQVATTREAAREIELSTKQQSSAVEQVNIAATNVAQATRETEVSTGQTVQTAAQLSSLAKELRRIVQPQASA